MDENKGPSHDHVVLDFVLKTTVLITNYSVLLKLAKCKSWIISFIQLSEVVYNVLCIYISFI